MNPEPSGLVPYVPPKLPLGARDAMNIDDNQLQSLAYLWRRSWLWPGTREDSHRDLLFGAGRWGGRDDAHDVELPHHRSTYD